MNISIYGTKNELVDFIRELTKKETAHSITFELPETTVHSIPAELIATDEPVAPVQQEKKPKKKWSKKQQMDIQAIKDAVKAQKASSRPDINSDDIVKMRDEEKKTFTEIGKILKCSAQTAINRYNKV